MFIRNRLRSLRDGEAADDRGSMAFLLMVTLVGLMVSALLVPMIITQTRATRFDSSRVLALDAAQTGVDVTLGAIRAAQTSSIGDPAKLPCGPLSGSVSNNNAAAYAVVIEYFTFDPVSEPYPSGNAMSCVPGYGTYDPGTGTTTPGFARFTSVGTVGVASNGTTSGRTLTSTYVFRTSNVNLLGGVLQIDGSAMLCMDAGPATPAVGAAVVLQACSQTTPPAARQVFAYRSDLTLQLLSSITTANPNGLCLNTARTPAVSGDAVKLAQCGDLGTPASYTQQWSYNDNGQYQAANALSSTTGTLPNLCMNVGTQAANQPVVVGSCGSGWVPSPSVGPGAAALPLSTGLGMVTQQWINFNEFGRCLDVTNQNVSSTYLIDYPCKQNPFAAAKTWNQLFTTPIFTSGVSSVTGLIYTSPSLVLKYCLTSPGVAGGSVTVKLCNGSASQTWTIYNGESTLSYSTKYTIVSGGLCLGLGPVYGWSSINVNACDGSTKQKWNANANVLNATLKDTAEK